MPDIVRSAQGGADLTLGMRRIIGAAARGDDEAALGAAGLVLQAAIKEELSTPGTGRIRRGETQRAGRGAFRTKQVAAPLALVPVPEQTARRMVTRGVPRTNIGGASRASAPGMPPAADTGALRNSIDTEWDPEERVQYVGTNMEYAAALNNGTTNAGKGHTTVILPRPFMLPAFAKAAPEMTNVVVQTLQIRGNDVSAQHGPAVAGPKGNQ